MERVAAVGSSKHALAQIQALARLPLDFVRAAPPAAAVLNRAAFQAVAAMVRSKHPKIRAAAFESVGKGTLGAGAPGIVEAAAEAAAAFTGRDGAVVRAALDASLALITYKTTDESAVKRALLCGAPSSRARGPGRLPRRSETSCLFF